MQLERCFMGLTEVSEPATGGGVRRHALVRSDHVVKAACAGMRR